MSDPTSLPNFPPPPDEHPLRGRVLDVLIDQGLGPDIDGDGDVAFTVQDQQLFVRCSEGDFQIMRVFGQWAIGEAVPADPLKRLETCNELTLQLNIVKLGLAHDTLVVTAEHVVSPQSDLPTPRRGVDRSWSSPASRCGTSASWAAGPTAAPAPASRPPREAPHERARQRRGRRRDRHHPAQPPADERPQRRDPGCPERGRRRGGGASRRLRRHPLRRREGLRRRRGHQGDGAHVLHGHGRSTRAPSRTSPGPSRASPSRPSPPSPATRSVAGARSRWRATSGSPRRTPSSGSPRSCSASSPAPVAPSGSPGWWDPPRPRT